MKEPLAVGVDMVPQNPVVENVDDVDNAGAVVEGRERAGDVLGTAEKCSTEKLHGDGSSSISAAVAAGGFELALHEALRLLSSRKGQCVMGQKGAEPIDHGHCCGTEFQQRRVNEHCVSTFATAA